MLADFQQALVDLTGSPALCVEVRGDPAVLHERYELTAREWGRLVGIVNDPGMECACTIYRANRLAPLVMNAPATCQALGPDLRRLVDEYWLGATETNVHFFVETDRFLRFLQAKRAHEGAVPHAAWAPLERESVLITAALAASRTEDQSPGLGAAAAAV